MQKTMSPDRAPEDGAAVKQLCSALAGRRIMVMGPETEAGYAAETEVIRGLQSLKKQYGAAFEIPERSESGQNKVIRLGDFVILVRGSGCDPWRELLRLSELLEHLQKADPEAVLLLSDTGVYGKLFGTAHALKEDETGYVCHTDPEDGAAQCMRALEHLCGRMAREEKFPVKIARIPGEDYPGTEAESGDETVCVRMAYHMLKVMLKGTPGEAYNLPGRGIGLTGIPEHSPLSPIPVVPDTGKAGRL